MSEFDTPPSRSVSGALIGVIVAALLLAVGGLVWTYVLSTHLTRQEAMPAVEAMPPGRWWTRYRMPGRPYRPGRQHPKRADRRLGRVVLLPLLLIAAVGLLVSSLVSTGTAGRGCGQAAVMVMAARQRATAGQAAGSSVMNLGGANCRTASPQPATGSR